MENVNNDPNVFRYSMQMFYKNEVHAFAKIALAFKTERSYTKMLETEIEHFKKLMNMENNNE